MNTRSMTLALLSTLVLSLVLSACQPSVGDAKKEFCESLNTLSTAVDGLQSIDENTSIDAAKQAREDVSKAWDDVVKAAEQLKDVQMKESEDAYKQMKKALDSVISGETTLGDSAQIISSGAEQLSVALKAINTTVCSVK